MAKLLYRLGLFAAKRAWLVVISWILLLVVGVTAMLSFGGTLSSAMSIPGTKAQTVIDNLKKSFPDASRGTGQVVFHKLNGDAFNAADRKAIAEALSKTTKLELVNSVVDPFQTAQTRLEGAQKLAKAQRQIADGYQTIKDKTAQLKAAQAKIADGRASLEANQTKLNQQAAQLATQLTDLETKLAQAKAGGAPAEALAQLQGGIAQVKGGQAQIAAGQKQLDAGKKTLETNEQKITDGFAKLAEAKAKLPGATEKTALAQKIYDASRGFKTVSSDGATAVAIVVFDLPIADVAADNRTAVVELIKAANLPGIQVEFSQDLTKSLNSILGIGEVVGLLIAAIVLFLMLGTFVAAGLPVISAIIGVGVAATLTLSASSTIEMTSTTPVLGVMLGLAVGIDYSLFILNRHRRQLKAGVGLRESIGLANGTSGNAVTFAGLTVIIALVALNLTGIGFLGLMGNAAAFAIAIAVLVALTFTPAVLSLLGMRVLNRRERKALAALKLAGASAATEHAAENQSEPLDLAAGPEDHHRQLWVTKHPVISSLLALAVIATVAIPSFSMRLGLPDGSSEPLDSTQYKAYSLITKAFGAGANGQIIAVATSQQPVRGDDLLKLKAQLASRIMTLDNVTAVVPAKDSPDAKSIMLQVQPSDGPSSLTTEQVVRELRNLAPTLNRDLGVELGVTGLAASNIDVSQKLSNALPLYLGTVLLLSLLLLILVFRSFAVPIVASVGFLLTVFATLGAVTAVFQWGWLGFIFDIHDPAPVLNFLPTMVIGILFGLAMDYQLFLASGMREAYVHGASAKRAVDLGIFGSRSVVIAAAIIMISVFGGFAFSHITMIRPVGLGLGVGVLVDAFLVRLVLVPAMLSLLGDKAWWLPKWLDR
ncbi:MAG: MMPL family transporter, partial [Micrococcales bacterium]